MHCEHGMLFVDPTQARFVPNGTRLEAGVGERTQTYPQVDIPYQGGF